MLAKSKKKLGRYRGKHGLDDAACAKRQATIQECVQVRAADLKDIVKSAQAAGYTSLRDIAGELNRQEIRTARGG